MLLFIFRKLENVLKVCILFIILQVTFYNVESIILCTIYTLFIISEN